MESAVTRRERTHTPSPAAARRRDTASPPPAPFGRPARDRFPEGFRTTAPALAAPPRWAVVQNPEHDRTDISLDRAVAFERASPMSCWLRDAGEEAWMHNSMSGCSRRRLAVVALAATAMVLGAGNPATSQEPNSSQAVDRKSSKSSPPDRNHYSRPGIPKTSGDPGAPAAAFLAQHSAARHRRHGRAGAPAARGRRASTRRWGGPATRLILTRPGLRAGGRPVARVQRTTARPNRHVAEPVARLTRNRRPPMILLAGPANGRVAHGWIPASTSPPHSVSRFPR